LTQERLNKAVDFGQALAALNCRFEGARGVMYCLTKREFARVMKMGEPGTGGFRQRSAPISATPLRTLLSVCPGCAAGSTTREMPPCRSQQVDQRGVPIVCTLSAAGSI
jgi:hypothetical protein